MKMPIITNLTSFSSNQLINEGGNIGEKKVQIKGCSQIKWSTTILYILMLTVALLPVVEADHCQTNREICHRYCRSLAGPGSDPRAGGGCILGCELAYWACKFFTRG